MELNIDFESLDKNAIYCLDCLREGIVEPIYDYVKHCKHTHRNMYTYRFCKDANEWHLSRAFTCDVKCATCLIKIANAASHTPKANAARERTMKVAKEQKNLSIEELSTLSNPSIRLKRRKYLDEMDKYPNSKIVSEVVFAFDYPVEAGSEEEKYLLDIEIQYAHDNKALFWNN